MQGVGAEALDRADVDDGGMLSTFCAHQGQGMLGGKKRALYVDRHHPIPVFFAGIGDGLFNADACVVDQHVEVPEIELYSRHKISDARFAGDVGLNKDHALARGFIEVGADHGIARRLEARNNGRANVLGAAGHDHDAGCAHAGLRHTAGYTPRRYCAARRACRCGLPSRHPR